MHLEASQGERVPPTTSSLSPPYIPSSSSRSPYDKSRQQHQKKKKLHSGECSNGGSCCPLSPAPAAEALGERGGSLLALLERRVPLGAFPSTSPKGIPLRAQELLCALPEGRRGAALLRQEDIACCSSSCCLVSCAGGKELLLSSSTARGFHQRAPLAAPAAAAGPSSPPAAAPWHSPAKLGLWKSLPGGGGGG